MVAQAVADISVLPGKTAAPLCADQPRLANCALIVRARYCARNKNLARLCCESCLAAGQIDGPPAWRMFQKWANIFWLNSLLCATFVLRCTYFNIESKEWDPLCPSWVQYNLPLSRLQSRLQHIYQGQPYARVDFILQSGTLDLASVRYKNRRTAENGETVIQKMMSCIFLRHVCIKKTYV